MYVERLSYLSERFNRNLNYDREQLSVSIL